MFLLVASLISYLIGSIPFGLVLVYIYTGKDIRNYGSGNIGATNVLRTAGRTLAAITLFLDSSKGFIVTIICKYLGLEMWIVPGLCAVIGHFYSIFLKFKGGKGVATSFGLLLAIDLYLFILAVATWLFIAILFRMSSLAAIVAFAAIPLFSLMLGLDTYLVVILLVLSILIIIKHKSNIINIINKRESKIKL